MTTLGVLVLSLRGMSHLAQCLESVRWADVVVVLHLGEEQPLVGVKPFSSLVVRNIASARDLGDLAGEIRTDWVLSLWGEERVEEQLAEGLRALCQRELSQTAWGYRISVRSHLLGRWAEGSLLGPSPALRLSRGAGAIPCGWWDSKGDGLPECPTLPGGWIGDYTATALKDGMDRLQSISDFWAERLQIQGQELNPTLAVLRPLQVFMRTIIRNGIFTNGLAGLTLSTLAAYATLLAGAKVWEARNVT